MAKSAQRKAIENYRSRLTERGVVRVELQALEADRGLLRALARKLIANGPEAHRIGAPFKRRLRASRRRREASWRRFCVRL